MDINLGKGMDGIAAVKEIRKMDGYKNTPIVALTAYVMNGDKEEFLAAGCTHYLGKPFRRKQLVDIIGTIIKENHPVN
jgi:CheY-like chemotaxis protein